MQRKMTTARPDYLAKVNAAGLVYTHEDRVSTSPELYRYWRDDAYYELSPKEIEVLHRASASVFAMLEEAGDYLLSPAGAADLARFGIPARAMRAIAESWNEEPACGSVYGRFDFRFGGLNHPEADQRIPKLYEFNADTPTSLVESLVQWEWFEDNRSLGATQWTNMYEDLVVAWQRNLALITRKIGAMPTVYFACSAEDASHEDEMNTLVLRDTCAAAGYRTETIYIENLWVDGDGRYRAGEDGPLIQVIFKLYPWEHMVHSEHADDLFNAMLDSGFNGASYQGGADITLHRPNGELTMGEVQGYGEEGFILQELALPPVFHREDEGKDVSTVLGVWMIDGEPSGLAIRESHGPITDNFANFIPHVVSR